MAPVQAGADASGQSAELRETLLALARAVARAMADADHEAMVARVAERSASPQRRSGKGRRRTGTA